MQCKWSQQQAKQLWSDVPGCPNRYRLHLCMWTVMGWEELPVMALLAEIKVCCSGIITALKESCFAAELPLGFLREFQ